MKAVDSYEIQFPKISTGFSESKKCPHQNLQAPALRRRSLIKKQLMPACHPQLALRTQAPGLLPLPAQG
jgi:hypothetical protein